MIVRNNTTLSLKISDFKNIISFRLDGSTEPGVIHLPLLGKTAPYQPFRDIQCEIADAQDTQPSTFKIFSSWLYFDDDISSIEHQCQRSGDTKCLLKCYEAAMSLLSFEFEDALEKDWPSASTAGHLSSMLHFQGARFKDDIIDAIVARWKRQGIVPSSEEVILVYSITKAANDPLRRLIADFYIWSGKTNAVDAVNLEFQRDLSNSLIASHAQMRGYLDQIRRILGPSGDQNDSIVVKPRFEYGEMEDYNNRCCNVGYNYQQMVSDLEASLEREKSKTKEIAGMKWPSAPYENDMAQFHEAPRYRDAFEKALENVRCK